MLRAPQSPVGEDFRRSTKQSPDPMTHNSGHFMFQSQSAFPNPPQKSSSRILVGAQTPCTVVALVAIDHNLSQVRDWCRVWCAD